MTTTPGSLGSAPASSTALRPHSTLALAQELLRRVQADGVAPGRSMKVLGRVAAELAPRTQLAGNRYSVACSQVPLRKLLAHPDVGSKGLHGATCVDVGCGNLNPLGGVFATVLFGAAKGIALDLERVLSIPAATRALFEVATWALAGAPGLGAAADPGLVARQLATFDLAKLAVGDAKGIDDRMLQFRQASAGETGLDNGSVDALTSKSFLEHIEDIDGVLAELARITRPGGVGFHAIDGYDHRHWGDDRVHPLEFLRDGSEASMVHGCNRIRPLQFAALFERHGFAVRRVVKGFQRVEITPALRASFAAPFRVLPDDVLAEGAAEFFVVRV